MSDPDIVTHNLGSSTLFTASAIRNDRGAAIHGVGISVQSKLLPLLLSVEKIDDRIVSATFKGNPKTTIISCYSPYSRLSDEALDEFYNKLSRAIEEVPIHSMLLIGGDMNAKIFARFSYHDSTNRTGILLIGLTEQHNLIIGSTTFQKLRSKLWTHRSPNEELSQIDFIMYRKRWRNSIHNCQAYSSSNPVGSDHRMITANVKLSVRGPPSPPSKKLSWQSLFSNKNLARRIENSISQQFDDLLETEKDYSNFVSISTKVPPKPRNIPTYSVDHVDVAAAQKTTLRSATKNIQNAQVDLRKTYDKCEDNRINNILHSFENLGSSSNTKNAWDLVKRLTDKKSSSVVFIE